MESNLPLHDLPAFCESLLGELGGSSSLSRAAASRAAIWEDKLLLLLTGLVDGSAELMAEVVVVVVDVPPVFPLPIDVVCC